MSCFTCGISVNVFDIAPLALEYTLDIQNLALTDSRMAGQVRLDDYAPLGAYSHAPNSPYKYAGIIP